MKYSKPYYGEATGLLYDLAMEKYGISAQTVVLCEECSEVIKAASKLLRYGKKNRQDLVEAFAEEIADAEIMMEQLTRYYGIDRDTIEQYKFAKRCRLKTSIDGDANGVADGKTEEKRV